MTLKNLTTSTKYETYEKEAIAKWTENSFGATIKKRDFHTEVAKAVEYEGYMMILYSSFPNDADNYEDILEHLYNNQGSAVIDSLIEVYWEIKNL